MVLKGQKQKPLTTEEVDSIKKWMEEGISHREIAKRLDRHYPSVSVRLVKIKKGDYAPRRTGRKPRPIKAKVVKEPVVKKPVIKKIKVTKEKVKQAKIEKELQKKRVIVPFVKGDMVELKINSKTVIYCMPHEVELKRKKYGLGV